MEEQKIYPGVEPKIEEPKVEAPKEDAPKEEAPPADAPEEEKAEDPKKEATPPKDEPKADPPAPIKRRSIYDDLKDERHDRQDWQQLAVSALQSQGIELKGTETLDEIKALLDTKADAKTPQEKSDADDDIKAFAEEANMNPEQLEKLLGVIEKRVGVKTQLPDDVREEIDANRTYRQEQEAKDRRAAEDREIEGKADYVKKQLGVQNDSDIPALMNELKKLAHTKEFHDKEVEYIIWKKADELKKLVSPKKASFELGGGGNAEAEKEVVDFSSGKVTPQQASAARTPSRATTTIEHPHK